MTAIECGTARRMIDLWLISLEDRQLHRVTSTWISFGFEAYSMGRVQCQNAIILAERRGDQNTTNHRHTRRAAGGTPLPSSTRRDAMRRNTTHVFLSVCKQATTNRTDCQTSHQPAACLSESVVARQQAIQDRPETSTANGRSA